VNYEGIGDVRGLSVGFIGADQLVNVHGYAPDTEFAGALPTLNVIFDSFQFEPGYSFVPAKKTALRDRIVQSALIGAIAGGCAPIILYLFKRHRSAGVASVHG
jgi:hypothetical protein